MFSDCKLTEKGLEYVGKRASTTSGVSCTNWDFQNKYPVRGHNYCRNPASAGLGPWCYTTTSGNWGYCDIPFCGEFKILLL